jgi:hypothetical protein
MTDCPQSSIHITTFYVTRILNYSSMIFSLLSAFIWLRVIRNDQQQQQKGQMFKYFFVGSFMETIIFILGSPDADYYKSSRGLAWKIWFIYFYCYIYYSLVTISNYLELAASFDCYIVIRNKFKFIQSKRFFKIILSTVVVVSFIIQINFLTDYIIRVDITINGTYNGTTIHYEYSSINSDDFAEFLKYYDKVLSVVREVLPLILLLIVNVLILKTLRQVMKKKRKIQRTNNNTTASQAELNKLKMIITICLDYYILRTPLVLIYFWNKDSDSVIWNCLYYYGNASYILSYLLKFFIYYFYNKKFKKYINLSLRFR